MLDGARSLGDPTLIHVTWFTPAEVFEVKLKHIIADMTRHCRPKTEGIGRRDLKPKLKLLKDLQ
jgi:hypothetical protein